MPTVSWRVLALLGSFAVCAAVGISLQQTLAFAVGHFRRTGAVRLTFVVCSDADFTAVMKNVTAAGMQTNIVNPADLDTGAAVSILTSAYAKIGILLEMKCDASKRILQIAHENALFNQKKSMSTWVVVMGSPVSDEVIQAKARLYEPAALNPIEYLSEPYTDTNNSAKLKEVGFRYNAEIVEDYRKRKKMKPTEIPKNASGIDAILPMNMLVDSDVILAVPTDRLTSEIYRLYRVQKITKKSKMKFLKSGTVYANGENIRVEEAAPPKRWSLQGAILTSTTGVFSIKTFTRMDDLSTRDKDAWSKMSYEIYGLLKVDLNFSSLIRFFDDYGWLRNGSFTALMGHLERGKADMSTAMMIMRDDRFRVLDYLDSYYRLQTGILFREPPLSSVSNIFQLPFSREVWICVAIVMLLVFAVLELEAAARARREPLSTKSDTVETAFSIFHAVAQKSYYQIPTSVSGRLVYFLLFTICLSLFTAFSAKIVTVMQLSSSSILAVEDLTQSNFEFGMQNNFPLFQVTLEDSVSNQETVREFYRKKVMKKKERVYLEPEIGIDRIRKGLFAFEDNARQREQELDDPAVELTAGYKLISETYEEAEKCGLKQIDLFPKPYLSTVLPKYSPLRQIFTPRMRWMAEVGHIARVWTRWIPQMPKCQVERIGFTNIGFRECHHAIFLFVYGAAAAIAVLAAETLYRRVSAHVSQLYASWK